MEEKAEIGIIGGTGVYFPELLENKKEIKIHTPYGAPSSLITLGCFKGKKLAFLFRHSKNHTHPPHAVKFKANIWALKQLGVKRILSPCAVGSLQDSIEPGQFVFIDQFIDRTHGRGYSFYDGGKVCHISVADPFCPELRNLLVSSAKQENIPHHSAGTYVCIEGPRFSTKAESKLYRSFGAHVIGMTLVPECVLAREAEICYASIATVTDYDTFKEETVSIKDIIATMNENNEKVRKLLANVIPKIEDERNCECKDALKEALI